MGLQCYWKGDSEWWMLVTEAISGNQQPQANHQAYPASFSSIHRMDMDHFLSTHTRRYRHGFLMMPDVPHTPTCTILHILDPRKQILEGELSHYFPQFVRSYLYPFQ
jgi:hypothetical protein